MPIIQTLNEGHVPVKIYTDDIEPTARQQLLNLATLPFIFHHVAAMPDVHAGIGATVGAVIATEKAIIPAAVGVDIGCGMLAVQTSLFAHDLDEKALKKIFDQINRDVPVGFAEHTEDRAFKKAAKNVEKALKKILQKHPDILKHRKNPNSWIYQLGTLGGGNHFIEICLDEHHHVWIMLHSGSRGIGNNIGTYFIQLARKEMQRHQIHLPDRDLAYLEEGSIFFNDYIEAVSWAQDYAAHNRELMMQLILTAMRRYLPPFQITSEVVNCHHNYVAKEKHFGKTVWLTRKGAIRAKNNDLGIIPGSMGAQSFIVRGRGNPDSFYSCAHGAGRKMSRTQANKTFKEQDLITQTEGVMCRKDKGVLDEIPAAYKNIQDVMKNQSDLVEVVHTLKQILCIKG